MDFGIRLKCPAFKCSNFLDVLDASRCLDLRVNNDLKLWDKILNMRRNQIVPTSLNLSFGRVNEARICPNSSCKCITLPPFSNLKLDEMFSEKYTYLGMRMHVCRCGASVCAECSQSRSHPGISCEDFKKLSSSVAKIKDEINR